jgi:hypothetical protein
MRFFLSLTNSPKQVVELGRFLDDVGSSYFNICVVFDLADQTQLSQTQYKHALKKLKPKNTLFLSEKIYSKIHPLFVFYSRNFKTIEFVLGNILGYFCREYFETVSKSRKIVLDDGLIVVSIAKLLVKENRTKEFSFYSSYALLLDSKVYSLESHRRCESLDFSDLFTEQGTLGVFGSPLVESGFMSLDDLEFLVLNAMNFHNCTSVKYYMHRREILKFNSSIISEIYSENSDSINLVLQSSPIPTKWWSIYSSALVDLSLLQFPNLGYSFTRVEGVSKMNNPYLDSKGISTLQTIYDVYADLKFTEILCPRV